MRRKRTRHHRRFVSARLVAAIVAQPPTRAAELLRHAIRLLPELAPRQLERSDQQDALGEYAGLAAEAAALALQDPTVPADERPLLALQMLEAGRAVLLSQALQVRNDVTLLAERFPGLAADFIRLRDLLDRTAHATTQIGTDDRRRLARRFDGVLTEIRSQPGFASFALPPSMDDLVAQAVSGPVVAFDISMHGSNALLLTSSGTTCLPLPGLSVETVSTQVHTFHDALHDASHGRSAPARQAAQRQLARTLEWLWDNAAGPLLDALGYRGRLATGQAGPRVWWIPGGLLGQLPIHAAGYHTHPSDPAARAVLDRVISSYTPTIAALRHARQSPALIDSAAPGRALIVAMPTTPGVAGTLNHVLDEARTVGSRLPEAITLTEPDVPGAPIAADTSPTAANVLNLLGDCAIVHFACHGTTDSTDPSRSRLLLLDHATSPLTVAALAPVHLEHAQLAYLSACDTARSTDTRLADEAIHLASAFQLAGYPHVVGTLWTIDDEIAVQIADAFYAALATPSGELDVGNAAPALHHAVRAARDTFPAAPSLWAAHLHAGA